MLVWVVFILSIALVVRGFQEIIVEATGKKETIEILKGLRGRYEEHHRVQFTDDAVVAD